MAKREYALMKTYIVAFLSVAIAAYVVAAEPVMIANVPLSWPVSVAAQSSQAFVLNDAGMTIYDLANPAVPVVLGTSSISGTSPGAVEVNGNRAFLACYDGWHGTKWQGVQCLDITDRSRPQLLSTIPGSESDDPRVLQIGNNLVAFGQNGPYFLYDITEVTHPVIANPAVSGSHYLNGDLCVTQDGTNTLSLFRFEGGTFSLIDRLDLHAYFAVYSSLWVCQKESSLYIEGSEDVYDGQYSSSCEKLIVVEFDDAGLHVKSSHLMTAGGVPYGNKMRVTNGWVYYVSYNDGLSCFALTGSRMTPDIHVIIPAGDYLHLGIVNDFEIIGDMLLVACSDSFRVYRLPPVFNQPLDATVNAPDPANFSVDDSPMAGTTYRWQRLPYTGSGWVDVAPSSGYTGVDTVTLTVTSTTGAMNGDQFRCVVINAAGVSTSSPAVLTISGPSVPPAITRQPASRTAQTDYTASFSVTASGSAPLAYQWRKNGTSLADEGNIFGVFTTNLTITNVQPSDMGNYSVVVTNAFGSTTSIVADLTVVSPYTYVINNGTIIITGYSGPGNNVTIPSTIIGLPVVDIGDYAFYYCSLLTDVTIPDSVTRIGNNAFGGCPRLNCVKIGNRVTSIGNNAFSSCTSLTSVTLGNSVTSIGNYAFSNCSSLTSVIIPESVASIADSVFSGCSRLASVSIPQSVTTIGEWVFSACMSLTSIDVAVSNSVFCSNDGVLFNKGQTTLILCPQGKANTYTIPDSVTDISYYAFSGCASLTNVIIGTNITSIADYTFTHCTNLVSVTIGNSVTNIGTEAFSHCDSLNGVYFQGNAPGCGGWAFAWDMKATAYYLPGTTGWGTTFGGLPTEVLYFYPITPAISTHPNDQIVQPGDAATFAVRASGGFLSYQWKFNGTNIVDAGTVSGAKTSKLTLVNVLTNQAGNYSVVVTNAAGRVTSSVAIMVVGFVPVPYTFTASNGVITITGYTGSGGTVTIPAMIAGLPVRLIADSVFSGCSSLTSVTIPDSVITIGDWAFYDCTSLVSVLIGDRVTRIGDGAFCYCPNLTGIYFYGNVPDLGVDVFENDDNAFVYYLPGTSGWDVMFGGLPTTPWKLPRITKRSPVADPAAVGEGTSTAFSLTADDNADTVAATRGMSNITWYVDGVLKQETRVGAPNAITSAFTLKTDTNTVRGVAFLDLQVKAVALDKQGGTAETNWTVRVNNMPAAQTITFPALPVKVFGDPDFAAGARASSGLSIVYSNSNPAVVQVVGGMIHIVGAGTAVITASQPGNFDFKAATPVKQTLTVKALLTANVPGGGGTVTGTGLYLPGTKVALTAKPATGNTFLRWEDGSQTAARSLVMPNANLTVSAWFGVTTNVPKPVIAKPGPQRAMAGVPFSLALDITSDSLPAVTLAGLPSGLAYSAATKAIAGVPTASVTNRTVTVTAKNVNKTQATETFTMTVDPLPAWAQGNFNGWFGGAVGEGPISGDVTAQGKVSGKLSSLGTNYTFSAASYARRDGDGAFWVTATAGVAKVSLPLTLAVRNPAGVVPPNLSVADGWFAAAADGDPDATMWRNVWKDAGMTAVATNYTGYYTATLPGGSEYGSGYLLCTVDKLGGVKTAGKLADGTAVSLSGVLILDEAGRVFAVLYTAPAAYKGGGLFGVAEFVKTGVGAKVVVRLLDGEPFVWENLNPAATQVYGAGFNRDIGLSGGWYDTLGNLYAYYSDRVMTVGTEGTPVPEILVGTNRYDSVCWDPDGIALTVVTNKLGVMTGLSAPNAGVPVKVGAAYDYVNPTNAVGLTVGLTRATGVFKGSFKAWFDNATTHTPKSVAYEGVLTPEREDMDDGIAGRGFFLWADKSQYLNPQNKTVPYGFSWSYDLKILLPAPAP